MYSLNLLFISLAFTSGLRVSAGPISVAGTAREGNLVRRDFGNIKRGLCIGQGATEIASLEPGEIAWVTDWRSKQADDLVPLMPEGTKYYPMLWGNGADKTDEWDRNAQSAFDDGIRTFFGFNEPDHNPPDGSLISPEDAAAAWITHMNKWYDKGVYLVGPSPMRNDDTGVQWYKAYRRACNASGTTCKVNAHGRHWYGTDPADFKSKIEMWRSVYPDIDIWVTEFGCYIPNGPVAPDQAACVREITDWMDSQDYIKGYAYMWIYLLKAEGEPHPWNDVGAAYIA